MTRQGLQTVLAISVLARNISLGRSLENRVSSERQENIVVPCAQNLDVSAVCHNLQPHDAGFASLLQVETNGKSSIRNDDWHLGLESKQIAAVVEMPRAMNTTLTFDCIVASNHKMKQVTGNVMLLHGFPRWKEMWTPLLERLADNGYRSLACDQRGYSQGAKPAEEAAYNYNFLRDDIFAVAGEIFGSDQKFHLIGHDHGALLGWYAVGSAKEKDLVLSYTALSIPHPEAFSESLEKDWAQVQASQYFWYFTTPNASADALYQLMSPMGFASAADFEKAVWWYSGAFKVGVMSMPQQLDTIELLSGWDMLGLRWAILRRLLAMKSVGHDEDPHSASSLFSLVTASRPYRFFFGDRPLGPENFPVEGLQQQVHTGSISVPVLYVCGQDDDLVLCHNQYAQKTKEFCPAGYTFHLAACGHGMVEEDCAPGAKDQYERMIVEHITSA